MKFILLIKKILWVVVVAVAAVAIIAATGYFWLARAVNRSPCRVNCQPVSLEIKKGEGSREIARRLEQEKLIAKQWTFLIYGWLTGQSNRLKEGYYLLKPSQSPKEILAILASGRVAEYKITIPEGYNNRQIAEALSKKFSFTKDDFLAAAKDKEGYLFPDTYRFLINSQPEDIITRMTDNFQRRTKDLPPTKEQLILASIVEKEAKTLEDQKIVAGIFWTRLKQNIPLESCATVNYLLPQPKEHLSNQDIAINSPYNTYRYQGLPPAAISNPGLQSIQAVQNPTTSYYLFFLSDKNGKIYYSSTRQEHEIKKSAIL